MSSRPGEHTWRRFMRISTRALIVLTLLIGACLGWIVRDARIQRDSVAAIKRAGGMVHYDWEWHNGVINNYGKPPAPGWLVDRLGVDYFGHVSAVFIWNLKSPDRGLAQIANLTRLEALEIEGGLRLSDSGFAHLASLTRLEWLGIPRANLTDARLADLVMKELTAKISGSGNVEAAPKDAADIKISGSGNVRLLSRPGRLSSHVSGSGRITQASLDAAEGKDRR